MLTADLVDARRRDGALHLVAFEGPRRALAARLAGELLASMRSCVGASREEVEAGLAAVEAPPRARRLVLGLRKILDDHATWDGATTLDPITVRRAVFERASAVRQALADQGVFDRQRVLDEVAAQLGTTPAELEAALFADLRAAEVLREVAISSPAAVIERYASQQVQAVLLRAVRVRVRVRCDSPGAYRALFRQVKFLRLLHVLREGEDGWYEVEIDGPYSLFASVTRYGLQLALLVPVLEGAREYVLDAEVRWPAAGGGKEGADRVETLRFRHHGGGRTPSTRPLSDDAQALLEALRREATPWRAAVADAIVALPGVGLCVPDLVLVHAETGEVVYVELLGYWSRDAVWRRKALVERGTAERVLFVASSHLRVKEEVVEEQSSGALYVYKRVPSARVVLERVEALAARRLR